MDLNEYQKQACSFAMKGGDTLVYSILEIAEELVELVSRIDFTDLYLFSNNTICNDAMKALEEIKCNKEYFGRIAKKIRKGWASFNYSERVALMTYKTDDLATSECGDVLWGVANVAKHLGASLSDVAEKNISKLSERKSTNTIIGSGETVEERKTNV